MKQQGYVLFFFIWCLSHLGSNEVRAVMVAAGSCSAPRLKKKGARSSESGERVLLVEHWSVCAQYSELFRTSRQYSMLGALVRCLDTSAGTMSHSAPLTDTSGPVSLA